MTKPLSVLLYGEPINNAVLKIPERRNPGVLVQADTLANIVEQAGDLVTLIGKRVPFDDELRGEADALHEQLSEMLEGLKLEVAKAGERLEIG
jgi:hypothetical protein